MNDDRIDMLLSDYFKRSAPFTFRLRQKGELKMTKKIYKPAIAVLCAVLVFSGALFSIGLFRNSSENAFTITANAAELSESEYVPIGNLSYNRAVEPDSEIKGGFEVAFENVIKGDNIESISYSIDSGAFLITDELAENLISGKKTNKITGVDMYKKSLYSRITVPYSHQPDGDKNINNSIVFLSYDDTDGAIADFYRLKDSVFGSAKIAADAFEKYCNSILADNKLEVSITFKDGTVKKQNVVFMASALLSDDKAQTGNGSSSEKEYQHIYVKLNAKLV